MTRQDATTQNEATLSWTLSSSRDLRDDRRGLQLALGCAFLLHGALLAVRLAEGPSVTLPTPDAIIFPTKNVAIKEPVEIAVPEPAARTPEPAPVKVPVPAHLAPPEPLPVLDPPDLSADLRIAVEPIAVIPDPPEVRSQVPVRFARNMGRPVRIAGADPGYTEAARRSRTQGFVVLDAVIDKEGRVVEIEVLRRLSFGLTESAVRAVRGWRFEPATLGGRPIAVRYNLTVRFALQ